MIFESTSLLFQCMNSFVRWSLLLFFFFFSLFLQKRKVSNERLAGRLLARWPPLFEQIPLYEFRNRDILEAVVG